VSDARTPGGATPEVVVRLARREDAAFGPAAAGLIDAAAGDFDIARRDAAFLERKIATGRAALALLGSELVGFGYWSEWESGRFVSHSGLVVRRDLTGRGIGRRLKLALFESSRRRFPHATLMSLTSSPQVRALNLSLGFRVVPLERLTSDPAFWEGCRTCRNFAAVQAAGGRCCCEGMILEPADQPR
jgi:GNAT superfamily N-acetyltransferase